MELGDVDQVGEVDRLCFTLPWPTETYRRDLQFHGYTYYLVVERLPETKEERGQVVGFCGYWLISGEVHISTIGVHPDSRGLGLGEYLLASLLAESMKRGAESATLEVRASNYVAQRLYQKYGFEVTGRRRRYYRDNHEDALLMEVRSLTSESYSALFRKNWEQLMRRLEQGTSREERLRTEAHAASAG